MTLCGDSGGRRNNPGRRKSNSRTSSALTNGEITFDLDAGDCYVKPEIMQDDAELKAKADAINQKLSANLTMDFGTDRKEVLDKNTLKDWE